MVLHSEELWQVTKHQVALLYYEKDRHGLSIHYLQYLHRQKCLATTQTEDGCLLCRPQELRKNAMNKGTRERKCRVLVLVPQKAFW